MPGFISSGDRTFRVKVKGDLGDLAGMIRKLHRGGKPACNALTKRIYSSSAEQASEQFHRVEGWARTPLVQHKILDTRFEFYDVDKKRLVLVLEQTEMSENLTYPEQTANITVADVPIADVPVADVPVADVPVEKDTEAVTAQPIAQHYVSEETDAGYCVIM